MDVINDFNMDAFDGVAYTNAELVATLAVRCRAFQPG